MFKRELLFFSKKLKERAIQNKFREYHYRNERYKLSLEILDFIKNKKMGKNIFLKYSNQA